MHYTVSVSPQPAKDSYSNPYFKIDSVSALVVVTANNITTLCGEKTSIQQKYNIEFVSSNSQIQHRSGNPGYIRGYPLLLGKVNTPPGGMLVYNEGFQLKGANENGSCYNAPTIQTLNDFGDPVLNFGTDIIYGCGK